MILLGPGGDFSPDDILHMPADDILVWGCPGNIIPTQSLRNFAEEGAAPLMTLTGSPAGYDRRRIDLKSVTSAAYLTAPVLSTIAAWTLISIAMPIDSAPQGTESPQMISCLSAVGGTLSGFGLGGAGAGSTATSRTLARGSWCGVTPTSAGASVESYVQLPWPANPLEIRATVFRGVNGGAMRVDDLTEGLSVEAVDTRTSIPVPSLARLRVGSSDMGLGRYGRLRVFFYAILARYATDDEIDRIVWQAARSLIADEIPVRLAA